MLFCFCTQPRIYLTSLQTSAVQTHMAKPITPSSLCSQYREQALLGHDSSDLFTCLLQEEMNHCLDQICAEDKGSVRWPAQMQMLVKIYSLNLGFQFGTTIFQRRVKFPKLCFLRRICVWIYTYMVFFFLRQKHLQQYLLNTGPISPSKCSAI